MANDVTVNLSSSTGTSGVIGFIAKGVTYSGSASAANQIVFDGLNTKDNGLCNNDYSAEGVCDLKFAGSGNYPGTASSSTNLWNHLRIYANSTLTITPKVGVTITKVEIVYNSASSNVSNFKVGTTTVKPTNGVATWTGSAQDALVLTSQGTSRIKYFDITYTSGGETKLGTLTGTYGAAGTAIADGGEISVEEDTAFSFTAQNAESITITDADNNTVASSATSTLTWTPTVTEQNMYTVTAKRGTETKTLSFFLTVTAKQVEPVVPGSEFTDVIEAKNFPDASGSYQFLTYTSPTSSVTYSACIAKDSNDYLQFGNTNNDKRKDGIVVTANPKGYFIKSINVVWGKNQQTQRASAVFGQTEVYADNAQLYDAANGGVGTEIARGTGSYTYTLKNGETEYKAFGIKGAGNTCYLAKIEIVWGAPVDRAPAPTLAAATDLSDAENPGNFEDEVLVMVDGETQGNVYHYTLDGTVPAAETGATTFLYDENEGITITESATVTVAQIVNGIVGKTASMTFTKVEFHPELPEIAYLSDAKGWDKVFLREMTVNVETLPSKTGAHATEYYYTIGARNPFDKDGNLVEGAQELTAGFNHVFTTDDSSTTLRIAARRKGEIKQTSVYFPKFNPVTPFINIVEANGESMPEMETVTVELTSALDAAPNTYYTLNGVAILTADGVLNMDELLENGHVEVKDRTTETITFTLNRADYPDGITIHAANEYTYTPSTGSTTHSEFHYSEEAVYNGHWFGHDDDTAYLVYKPVTDLSTLNNEHGYMLTAIGRNNEVFVMSTDRQSERMQGIHANLYNGNIHLSKNGGHSHSEFYLEGNATDGYRLWCGGDGETGKRYLHNPNAADRQGLHVAQLADPDVALFDIVATPAAAATQAEGDAAQAQTLYLKFRNGEHNTLMFNTTGNGFNAFKDDAAHATANYRPVSIFTSGSTSTTGIGNVAVDPAGDDADAPVEYYDLQGRRVENPSAGIYIRRQGSVVSKVIVR